MAPAPTMVTAMRLSLSQGPGSVNAMRFGPSETTFGLYTTAFRLWGTAFRLRAAGVSAYNQDVRCRSARSATRDQESPMKLVRYSVRGSSPRLGALAGDRIRCLGETYHRYLAGRG